MGLLDQKKKIDPEIQRYMDNGRRVIQERMEKNEDPAYRLMREAIPLTDDDYAEVGRKEFKKATSWGNVLTKQAASGLASVNVSLARTTKDIIKLADLPTRIVRDTLGIETHEPGVKFLEKYIKGQQEYQEKVGVSEELGRLPMYHPKRIIGTGLQAVPQVATVAATSLLSPAAGISQMIGASGALGLIAYGSSAEEAKSEGANEVQQVLHGITAAEIEVLTEMPVFAAVGKLWKYLKVGGVGKKAGVDFVTKLLKGLGMYGKGLALETAQEVEAYLGGQLSKKIHYDPKATITLKDAIEAGYGGLSMAATVGLAGVPGMAAKLATKKTGKDIVPKETPDKGIATPTEATKKQQVLNTFLTNLDEGMKTGKVGDIAFTPDIAINAIRQVHAEGILTDENIEEFHDKYPSLRPGLNKIKGEKIATDIDSGVKETERVEREAAAQEQVRLQGIEQERVRVEKREAAKVKRREILERKFQKEGAETELTPEQKIWAKKEQGRINSIKKTKDKIQGFEDELRYYEETKRDNPEIYKDLKSEHNKAIIELENAKKDLKFYEDKGKKVEVVSTKTEVDQLETTESIQKRTAGDYKAYDAAKDERVEKAKTLAKTLKPGDKISVQGGDLELTVDGIMTTQDGKTAVRLIDKDGETQILDSTFLIPAQYTTKEGKAREDIPIIKRAKEAAKEPSAVGFNKLGEMGKAIGKNYRQKVYNDIKQGISQRKNSSAEQMAEAVYKRGYESFEDINKALDIGQKIRDHGLTGKELSNELNKALDKYFPAPPAQGTVEGEVAKEVAKEPVKFIGMQKIEGEPSQTMVEATTGKMKGGQIDYDAERHEIVNLAEYKKAVGEVAPEKAEAGKEPVDLDKIKYKEGGDAIGKEYHGYITAYDAKNKKIGTVDYSYFNDKTAVKMIEVEPEYRRQGVATKLLAKLQEGSKTPIEMQGTFATKEGQALFDKFKAAKPQPAVSPAEAKPQLAGSTIEKEGIGEVGAKIEPLDDLKKNDIINEFEQGRAEIYLESTCVDCKGKAQFVDEQMEKAVPLSKKSKPIKKLKEIGEIDKEWIADADFYINEDYVIGIHSATEHFFKFEGAFFEKSDMSIDVLREAGRETIEVKPISKPTPKEAKVEVAEKAKKPVSKIRTLRGAIKELGGFNFLNFTGELKNLNVYDIKAISNKNGIGIDRGVNELIADGWLDQNATVDSFLEDARTNPEFFSRDRVTADITTKKPHELSAEEKRTKAEMEHEPEAPPEGEYITMNAEDLPKGKQLTLLEGKTARGWDIYSVEEKDEFEVTLKDGVTITLKPLDKVEVLKSDVGKAKKAKAKEPYRMSKGEWKEEHAFEDINPYAHKYIVEQAIKEGKIDSHPDYPELTETTTEVISPDGMYVDRSKTKVSKKEGIEATYYGVYGKDGRFKSWRTETEIERIKKARGKKTLDLKQEAYGKQKAITGKGAKEQLGLGLEVKKEDELFKKAKSAEKPTERINKDTIILKAKDTPRKTSDIPGVYLSADKKYAGAYANGEVKAAHQRGTLTPQNGAIIEVKIDSEESIGFGDVMQSLEKDDLYDLLIESGAEEETAERLSAKPEEAADYVDVISGTGWMQRGIGYDEVFRDNVKWGDIVKIEIFKDGKLNKTIIGGAKVETDEMTFYTGTPYTEHLETLEEAKPAEKPAGEIEPTKEDIEAFIKPLHHKYYLEGQKKGIAAEKLNAYGALQINKLVGSKLRAYVDMDAVKQYLTEKPIDKPSGGVKEGAIYQREQTDKQYVPITRKEADILFDKGAADLVSRFNVRGVAETTGEEGYYMRMPVQKELAGYGEAGKQPKYSEEVMELYEKYRKRHGKTESAVSITGGEADKQRGRFAARLRDKEKQFATKATKPQDTITRADLKEIFSGMANVRTGQDKNGNFYFGIEGKPKVIITEVNHIDGYVETSSGRIPVGSFLKDHIQLKTGGAGATADIGTAWHEFHHYLEGNGILSNNDITALNRATGKLEATEEDRAAYVGDNLSSWQSQKNLRIKRILKKIADFMNAIYEFVTRTRTARGVLADISSGKILEREVAGRTVQTTVPAFAQTAERFYSQVIKTVETKMPNKMAASDVMNWLKKQPGIKQAELEWIGIEDMLEGKKVVGKDELVQLLRENEVRVEEVEKRKAVKIENAHFVKTDSGVSYMDSDTDQMLGYITKNKDDTYTINSQLIGGLWSVLDTVNTLNRAKDVLATHVSREDIDTTKFSQYQLPGEKENYRELVFSLPNAELEENYKTGLISKEDKLAQEFSSSHFPEVVNPFAHVRINERIDADGKRILFVEEVQSDWGNALMSEFDKFKEERYPQIAKLEKGKELTDLEQKAKNEFVTLKIKGKYGTTPFMPWWDKSSEYTMKRIVRMAAEQGFSKVAWITGQQTELRYDLSKHYEALRVRRDSENNFTIIGELVKGGVHEIGQISSDKLSGAVGKDLAERINNQKESYKEYRGLDLKIKANWAYALYDEMIPQYLKKFGKKYGAEIGTTDLGKRQGVSAKEERARQMAGEKPGAAFEENVIVHSFTLTPELKRTALYEGMPLFAMAGKKAIGAPTGALEQEAQKEQPKYATKPIDYVELLKTYQKEAEVKQESIGKPTAAFDKFIKRVIPGLKDNKQKLKYGYDNSRIDGEAFDLPETSTLFETFKYNMVNWLDPQKKIQKAIEESTGTIPEYADVLTKEMLRISKTKADRDTAEQKHFKPIKRSIGVNKLTVDTVDEFLYGRHAQEANARLRLTNAKLKLNDLNKLREGNDLLIKIKEIDISFEKNPFSARQDQYYNLLESELKNPKNEKETKFKERWEHFKSKPSGMTDAEAQKIVEKYKNNKALQNIAKRFDAMNNEKLDILLEAGRLSQEEYDAIKGTFKYYAPLRREGFESKPKIGSGIQLLMQDIKVRGGSTKRAVNILANAMADFDATLIKRRKSESARALLELVKLNPNENVWRIETPRKVPGYDTSGNIVLYNDMTVQPNELKIKVDGKLYLISANNEHSFRVIKGLRGDNYQSGPIVNALGKLNRYLAMINTTLSPEFMINNFARDTGTAFFNLSNTEIANVKSQVLKDIPKSMKGLRSYLRGDGTHEWAKHAKLFDKSGARIGWIDFAGDIDQRARKLEKEINLFRDGHVTKKKIHDLGKLIEDYNTIVENAVRLSTFKNAVDQGVSVNKAALMAKDLTVNFNQKGIYGSLFNSLYLFSNAGIQGSAKVLSVLKNSPKARKAVYVSMVAATSLAIANSGLGGDDDDGVPYYDKIEDFVKERNMIIMLPGTKGKYVKIPLPWGYNVFWAMGTEVGDMVTQKDYTVTGGMTRMMATITGAFNPLQSSTLLQTISPTVTDPFVQIAENKTWSGNPLMPENSPFADVEKPDSELYWASARRASVELARALNYISGGNQIRPGLMDVSPETLDLVWDTFAGSAGKFAMDTLSLPITLTEPDVIVRKIPIARRVIGEKSEYADSAKFRENVAHVYLLRDEIEEYPKRSLDIKKDKTWRLLGSAKDAESTIRSLNKRLKQATTQEAKDGIKKRILIIQQRFNKKFLDMP